MRYDSSIMMVIDLESTCWRTKEESEGKVSEIIEVGGCILDRRHLEVRDKFQIYVHPIRSEISEFCTEYTGITPAIVQEKGVSYPQAMGEIWRQMAMHKTGVWGSWGDYDREMLLRSCALNYCDYPMPDTHFNIKAHEAMIRGRDRGVGQKRAVQSWGLEWVGRNHCGMDDAYMAALVYLETLRPHEMPVL